MSQNEQSRERRFANGLGKPIAIYEMHLGSWRRVAQEGGRSLSHRELASVVSLLRNGQTHNSEVVVIGNFTPVPRKNYLIGVPRGGLWKERLNSDARDYGGSGLGNMGAVEAAPVPCHGRRFSLPLILPPLAILFFTNEGGGAG